jgi:hypothetical protein
MGKGGGGTTVTKTEPWDEQKKFLQTGFQATNVLADPWLVRDKNGNITRIKTVNNALAPAYYSGNTVAPQSAWTTQALQMQAQAAQDMAKDPTMKAANSAAQQIANGTALANNAGLAQLNALAKTAPVTQQQALTGNGAMNSLNKLANSNTLAGNAGYGTLNTLAGQATGAGNAGLTALNKYATQNFNAGNSALKNLQGTAGAGINSGNAALAQLNMLAQNDNPYMDNLYKRANNQAQASLDSNFNRSGRYGSGSHEAAAADAANNLADQMYSNLYNQRINAANAASSSYLQGMNEGINAQQVAGQLYNQGLGMNINAAQDAAGAYNQALAQRIAAAQDAGSLYNQDLSTRAGMLSNAGSLYNTGIGNIINAYNQQAGAANNAASAYNTGVGQRAAAAQIGQQLANQRYTDAAMLSEAGGVKDDYKQQLINAAIDRYNYNAQRPLQALSTYNQLISGNYGGTSTATGQQSGGSRLGNALGGALGGAGLVSALATNPAGWMIGAGAGLGGMLGLL